MDKLRRDPFTASMFRRQFAPAIISALGLAVGDMADAIVVGQRVGEVGLAAISLALPVFMVINVIMHGLGLGGSIRYSAKMADGKQSEAISGFHGLYLAALLFGAVLALVGRAFLTPLTVLLGADPSESLLFSVSRKYVGIIVCAVPLFFASYILNYYLRNDDQERLASIGFTVGNLSDLALNVVLVLVLDWGAAGAAWATVIGQVIALLFYLIGMWWTEPCLRLYPDGVRMKGWTRKRRTESCLRLFPFHPDFSGILGCFRVGFASSTQYLFSMLFVFFSNRILMEQAGSGGVAVFDVVQNTSFLILYLYEASAKAAQPIQSTFLGEHNLVGLRQTLRLALGWGTLAGGVAICVVSIFPQWICAIFGLTDSTTVELGCYALRVYCLGAWLAGINVILESSYQAKGNERAAFLIALLRGAVFPIPLALILPTLRDGAYWWLYPVTEVGTLLVFLLVNRDSSAANGTLEQNPIKQWIINSNIEEVAQVTAEVESFCETWGANPKQIYFVTMTVEELCMAILNKGFHGQNGFLQVTVVAQEDRVFSLHIRDSAVSFDPFSLQTQKVGSESGVDMDAIGVLVIREKAKEFHYRRYQGFNSLVVKI